MIIYYFDFLFCEFRLALLDLGTSSEVPAGKCYVDHICVDSRFRGKGIGKVLLDMAEIDAKKRGCKVRIVIKC